MAALPFALRRPALLLRDLLADRERPDLDALAAIDDPERFVWAILPHAARTFSACIAMLPARSARAAAVAYLYCRILDTYEDLSAGPDEAVASLSAFSARFDGLTDATGALTNASGAHAHDASASAPSRSTGPASQALPHVPPPGDERAEDARDRAHLLLVQRCELVDRVFLNLPPTVQVIIAELVREMAAGMAWAAHSFDQQGGVLRGNEQLTRYCRAVLGEPVRFVARMTLLGRTGSAQLTPQQREASMRAGEFIQLANVTRDVEKDLARGVAFRESLRPLLGARVARPGRVAARPPGAAEPGSTPGSGETHDSDGSSRTTNAAETVRAARAELLDIALSHAPSYAELLQLLDGGLFSLTRASALLMLLFTERYYGGCAERVGRPRAARRRSGLSLLAATALAVFSRGWSLRCQRRSLAQLAALKPKPPGRPA